MKIRRLLLLLSLGLIIALGNYVYQSVFETITLTEETLHFTIDEGITETLIVDKDTKYTFFLSGITDTDSNDNEVYQCNAYEVLNSTEFTCLRYGGQNPITFQVSFEKDGEYFYINDMGNTTLISNNYRAIGRIELEEGTYTVTIHNLYGDYHNTAKIENSAIFSNIFKMVFGGIGLVGLIIVFLLLLFVFKKRPKREVNRYTDNYEQHINKQDQNNNMYDDDDPFSKYD